MTVVSKIATLPDAGNGAAPADMAELGELYQIQGISRADQAMRRRWEAYGLPSVTPLTSYADYASATAKRREIAEARTACEEELSAARTELARGFAARRENETEQQARDILAGRPDRAFEGVEELRSQIARLDTRLRAYVEALRMQDEVVATIRSERSIDANDTMAGAHADAVGSIVAAIGQLRVALDREYASRIAIADAGFDIRLPIFAMHGMFGHGGLLEDAERRAGKYLR